MGSCQLGEEAGDQGRPLKVRAFFGLPLPAAHREGLARYISSCERLAPQFRWTLEENLHLTVRFLGHVELSLAEAIAAGVAAAPPAAFVLQLGDAGAFKRGKLARVVWLGVRAGEREAAELAAMVEAECVRAGLEEENRRFQPHLTLARARPREGAALPLLPAPPEMEPWRAEELILYRSRLGRAGSVYEPLVNIKLR
jgi:RNA 2',3'-cyclic 3'-phosphodiesterase